MSNELKNLFGFMAELGGDLEEFLNALYEGKVNRDQVPGLTDDTESAMKKALEQIGAEKGDPTDLDALWEAAEANLPKPAPERKLKAWERATKAPAANGQPKPAQVEVQEAARKAAWKAATTDFGSEDMRDLGDDDLREEIVEVFDAGHKKHHLPFKISSEESKEQVTRMMARVRTSEEPVTNEILAKWVDARFARIAESRTAGDRVRKDLGSQRIAEGLFGALCGLIREGGYSAAMAGYAVRMAQEGLKDEDSVAVLQRTAALGGTDGAFTRAYRRVVRDAPPARSATTETPDSEEPAVGRAFARRGSRDRQPEPPAPRKRRAWDRG